MSMPVLFPLLRAAWKACAHVQGRLHGGPGGNRPRQCGTGEALESRVHLSGVSYIASSAATLGAAPWCVRTADLNGDGHEDMVVVAKDIASVQVFLGNGDQTFQRPRTYQVSLVNTPPLNIQVKDMQSRCVAIDDIDGDGNLDLVVPNYGAQAISIFYGQGDGTFAPAVAIATDIGPASLATPRGVVTGDFDRNGLTDIAVTNLAGNTVSVVLNAGDGVFRPAVHYAVGSSPVVVVTGDFNGDGVSDLATANYGDTTASILYGNGDGTFQKQKRRLAGPVPQDIVVADFDGDGDDDLAVSGGDRRVGVLLSNGAAQTFGKLARYRVGTGAHGLVARDLNGDGIVDLAVTNYFRNSVSVLQGDGDGTFSGRKTFKVPVRGPRSIAAADFDGDGGLDLAVVGSVSNQYSILWSNVGPSAINLSETSVAPMAAGTKVADLTAEDPTSGDSLRFALVKGAGSQDNGSFRVEQTADGWVLKARRPLTAAKGTYHILLQVTDAAGETFTKAFEITVTQS